MAAPRVLSRSVGPFSIGTWILLTLVIILVSYWWNGKDKKT